MTKCQMTNVLTICYLFLGVETCFAGEIFAAPYGLG